MIFCVILFLLPFLHVNVGLNLADQGYNLYNFESFPDMNETWMIATLAANLTGKFFTLLPFGSCMLGMNVYCTLLLSGISVGFYLLLSRNYSRYCVFVGLLIAICFSWAPKVTLYQYLSYYLFCLGAVILVQGLKKEKRIFLYAAGIVLGINLFVRFPNILQVSLILVVWGAGILGRRKIKDVVKDTLICVAGYMTIVLPVIAGIELRMGFGTYLNMVESLFAMTDEAATYTPFAMFSAMYSSYLENMKWFVWFPVVAVAGTVLYGFFAKKIFRYVVLALTELAFLIVLRVYWYWGIFNMQYTAYHSVYVWGVCFLLLAMMVFAAAVFMKKLSVESRLYALAGLLIIFITPLGSNNALYSNFNNLYLLAPVAIGTLAAVWKEYGEKTQEAKKQVWKGSLKPSVMVAYTLCAVLLFQTFMFHFFFVFGDAGVGEGAKVQVEGNAKLAGIYTTEENARILSELTAFCKQNNMDEREVIVWAHSPMIYYAMDFECALGHSWPGLASYPYEEYCRDLESQETEPFVIYEAYSYPNLLEGAENMDAKTQALYHYMNERNYSEIFRNQSYVVCAPENFE